MVRFQPVSPSSRRKPDSSATIVKCGDTDWFVGEITVSNSLVWGEPSSVTNGPATTERVLRVESDRIVAQCRTSVAGDDPVAVSVRDEFPAELDVSDVQFRDDSDLDDCEATPTAVSFDSVVHPGEVVETTYEIHVDAEPTEPYDLPTIVRALPMDDHEPDDGHPTVRGGAAATAAAGGATRNADPAATVEALVEAFRSPRVSEERLGLLRDHLTDGTSSSTDVRVAHVESQLARFEAYVDALETFLDDNGTGQEALAELRTDLESQQTRQAALESDVESVVDEVATLRTEVGELRDEIEQLRSLMESLSTVFVDEDGDADASADANPQDLQH